MINNNNILNNKKSKHKLIQANKKKIKKRQKLQACQATKRNSQSTVIQLNLTG
jgi:hypothetical protein